MYKYIFICKYIHVFLDKKQPNQSYGIRAAVPSSVGLPDIPEQTQLDPPNPPEQHGLWKRWHLLAWAVPQRAATFFCEWLEKDLGVF